MKSLLKNFKDKLKKIGPIVKIYEFIIGGLKKYAYKIKTSLADIIADNKAISYIKAVNHRKVRNKGIIRVAFIVQMAEIWDKESPIYEAMKENAQFEPEMIVVPVYNRVTEQIEPEYGDNYFINKYPEAICAYDKSNWINLAEKEYDYVFFQRPYDLYLPEGLKSTDIVKFSKVCYIPYGFSGSDVFNAGNTDKIFFRNVRLAFLESDYMVNLLRKQFFFPTEKKQHKILNKGYPALIPYFSFPVISEIKRVMWTPRWSTDPVSGGSNFLKYKDVFLDIADRFSQYEFVFRPHPLMFDEILKQQLMTKTEVDQYIVELKNKKIVYDRNTILYDSLKDIDMLITDYSSIIIQYYLTGRPIIYCESCIELNDTYQMMKKGMYLIKSESDFKTVVADVLKGHDPLKEYRVKTINSEFDIHKNAVENIIGEIIKDYEENMQ